MHFDTNFEMNAKGENETKLKEIINLSYKQMIGCFTNENNKTI